MDPRTRKVRLRVLTARQVKPWPGSPLKRTEGNRGLTPFTRAEALAYALLAFPDRPGQEGILKNQKGETYG